MSALPVLVDYDNVDSNLKGGGPVTLARALVSLIPPSIVTSHSDVLVRLYGGWRSQGVLTNYAQRLVPDIRNDSPSTLVVNHLGAQTSVRFIVELAEKPFGATAILSETFAKDRGVRNFRARQAPLANCADSLACGFAAYMGTTSGTACVVEACGNRLIDVFVRDEQKMVDTLIVADIAQKAAIERVRDIVLVSSDIDMWPGVLLALRLGCHLTHIHPRRNTRTQRHLLDTLDGSLRQFYEQLSI